MSDLQIRNLRPEEISIAVDWAAAEGWNPGLGDAACFAIPDAKGFFVGEIDGEPVATISCVNFDDRFAFLGFYIVRSGFRGAMTRSVDGCVRRAVANASSTGRSSPLIVLAAMNTGRDVGTRKNRRTRPAPRPAATAGNSSESNLRLPVTLTRAGSAPISMMRRADSSLCMQNRSTSASTRLKNPRAIR